MKYKVSEQSIQYIWMIGHLASHYTTKFYKHAKTEKVGDLTIQYTCQICWNRICTAWNKGIKETTNHMAKHIKRMSLQHAMKYYVNEQNQIFHNFVIHLKRFLQHSAWNIVLTDRIQIIKQLSNSCASLHKIQCYTIFTPDNLPMEAFVGLHFNQKRPTTCGLWNFDKI